eukprot:TRINITY_DN17417_c0_g1_i1.p1 TRINITY_DN17417_c0_g1~~TRINITY_DN17417_c0_g1_i1.p1  ORF type:complete len:549 (+),score=136.01 TRINITY_DN17417_c0_g1_i1:36-1682(+)
MSFLKRHDKPSEALQAAARMSGLTLYWVKYYGKEQVPESRGNSIVDYALHQILVTKVASKKQGWKPPRVEFSIGISGVKVTDRSNGNVFLDLPLQNISYCQDDRRGNNIFCFIAKETPTSPQCCYAFKSYNQAQEIMNAMGVAFNEAASQTKSGAGRGGSRGGRGGNRGRGRGSTASRGRGRGNAWGGNNQGQPQQRQSQQQQQRQSQRSSGAPANVEAELKNLEKEFESDFKFAVKRAAVTEKVKSTTTDDAFGGGSNPGSASQGFDSSFDDAFGGSPTAAPTMPASNPPQRSGSRGNNPYARQRGAPPPSQLSATSQIQVPQEAMKLRKQAKPAPAAAPGDDDDDDFAQLASARLSNGPTPIPEADKAAIPAAGDMYPPEEVPSLDTFANGDADESDDDNELINQLSANLDPQAASDSQPEPQIQEEHDENDNAEEVDGDDGSEAVEEMALVKLCQHIWTLATPDEDGCLDGGQMRPLMMMSGLPMDVLGEVWAMVDDEQQGKINYRQLGFLLGLISQAQKDEELDISVIGPATEPPVLEGLKPLE